MIANPETSGEVREHAQVDIEKLENWLEYYDWLNRLIDSFETKEILDLIPVNKKADQTE